MFYLFGFLLRMDEVHYDLVLIKGQHLRLDRFAVTPLNELGWFSTFRSVCSDRLLGKGGLWCRMLVKIWDLLLACGGVGGRRDYCSVIKKWKLYHTNPLQPGVVWVGIGCSDYVLQYYEHAYYGVLYVITCTNVHRYWLQN